MRGAGHLAEVFAVAGTVVLLIVGTPAGAAQGAPPPDPATGLYTDPEGFYTVPVPPGWTAEARGGLGVLTSPDGRIEVFTLSLATTDPSAALARAWETVDPAFEQAAVQELEAPPPAGIDAMRLVTYAAPDDRIVQAVVRLAGDRSYVTIFAGDLAAIAERQSQVVIIDSGFQVVGVEAVDIAGTDPGALTPELVAELEDFIREAMAAAEVPGLAIAVVQGGEVVYARGFGVRELGGSEPVTADTLMMIGSTGKTMTTMLMATLVDEGAMSWDTPVVELLPQFRLSDPELTRQLTVRHLVCACTGVPRRDLELILNAHEMTAEDVVESLADFRLFTAFGEAFQYSNQMVAVGGYAAAAADGAAYGELFDGWEESLERRVLDPIGMDDTLVRFEEVRARENVATPHGLRLGGSYQPLPIEMESVVLPVAPAGGLWSNARDMGRYLITELAFGVAPDGQRVVSERSLRETWRPQVPISADLGYALGWMVGSYKGLDLVAHGGNTFGFTADLAFLPDEGIGVSILINASRMNGVAEAIRTRLFELLYALEPEAPAMLAFQVESARQALALVPPLHPLDAGAVGELLGEYRNDALGGLRLRLEEGELIADVGEFASELGATDEASARFVTTTPPFLGVEYLLEGREGRPVVVLTWQGEAYVFERR